MAIQTQGHPQQEHAWLQKGSEKLYWFHLLIVILAPLFFIAGFVLWILIPELHSSSLSLLVIIPGILFSLVLLVFQWAFYSPSAAHKQRIITTVVPPKPPEAKPALVPPPGQDADADVPGLLPPTDPKTIQQRQRVVKEIYKELVKHGTSAIVLTGMAGVGKSTLAALIYRHAEEKREAKRGMFQAQAIWLRIDASTTTMATLAEKFFKALNKPMPNFSGLSFQGQAQVLFHAMNTTDQARLIVLDQFESLLDRQTGEVLPEHEGFGEWLDLLNSQPCRCRVLLTSRTRPRGKRAYPPTHLEEHLVNGLNSDEGIELLRKQGVSASKEDLSRAVKYCDGHAYALILLAALLRNNRGLSLSTIFNNSMYIQLWQGNIARNLLDYIFHDQLTEVERKLLLAFSVYREDVPLRAALVVEDFIHLASKADVMFALQVLLAQHLLAATKDERYQLHVIVADYARNHFVEDDEQGNQRALEARHAEALQYYSEQLDENPIPFNERKRIEDVHLLIEMIWQMCQATEWEEAYNLMDKENLFDDLKRFGGNEILLELFLPLLPPERWTTDASKKIKIYEYLGRIYRTLGEKQKARDYLESALHLCEQEGDDKGEGAALSYLGRVFADMGEREQALHYLDQALSLRRRIGDWEGEGWTLDNLGRVYSELGQNEKALGYSQQALVILQRHGNRKGEGRTLSTLGRILTNLGQMEEAEKKLMDALEVSQAIGDRGGEGRTLHNLGLLYANLGKRQKAREFYERALHIRRQVRNRRGEGRILQNIGQFYHDLDQPDKALHYFKLALSVLREVGDLAGEASTLYNIGLLYFRQCRYNAALASCLLAEMIFRKIQSPVSDDNQNLKNKIREEVGVQEYDSLLEQVKLNPSEILERVLL